MTEARAWPFIAYQARVVDDQAEIAGAVPCEPLHHALELSRAAFAYSERVHPHGRKRVGRCGRKRHTERKGSEALAHLSLLQLTDRGMEEEGIDLHHAVIGQETALPPVGGVEGVDQRIVAVLNAIRSEKLSHAMHRAQLQSLLCFRGPGSWRVVPVDCVMTPQWGVGRRAR